MRSDVATSTTRPDRELGNQLGDMTKRIGSLERLAGEAAAPTYDNWADLLAQGDEAPVGSLGLLLDIGQPVIKLTGGWSPTVVARDVAVTTSSTGAATLPFPVPFLTPPAVTCIDADAGQTGARLIALVRANLTAADFRFVAFDQAGALWASKVIRVGYVAALRP